MLLLTLKYKIRNVAVLRYAEPGNSLKPMPRFLKANGLIT